MPENEAQDKLGTPNPEAGDAAESTQTTGAPEQDGQGGLSPEDTARLHLSWKAKAERADALEAENAELKKRQDQPPDDQPQSVGATVDELEQRAREFADKGDAVAAYVLRAEARAQEREAMLVREIGNLRQLDQIKEDGERQEVEAHFVKNRHRLGDIKAARSEIRAKKLEAENQALNERLKAIEREKSPAEGAVRLPPREVSSVENKARKMTYAQFDREAERIRAEQGDLAAMLFKDQIAKKKIEFTD